MELWDGVSHFSQSAKKMKVKKGQPAPCHLPLS